MVIKKTGEQECGEYRSFIKGDTGPDLPAQLDTEKSDLVIFVTSDFLGKGDEDYGELLTQSFFFVLTQKEYLPRFIVFINKGVVLSCEGSVILGSLIDLEKRGVKIYSSGACLDHYQIKHKLCVGSVANMYTIMEKVSKAGRVLTI